MYVCGEEEEESQIDDTSLGRRGDTNFQLKPKSSCGCSALSSFSDVCFPLKATPGSKQQSAFMVLRWPTAIQIPQKVSSQAI
ncbi:Hypothetical predicted protein [Podarcis lilfordi]|uniref:Uncharacterized protein n=1 Tax=Podarcis lilfordi TaxID=74358 RepID=A0AA35K4W5_9SAUR|nr:Hypothetical predicted protein [Podarcis lilfordi]